MGSVPGLNQLQAWHEPEGVFWGHGLYCTRKNVKMREMKAVGGLVLSGIRHRVSDVSECVIRVSPVLRRGIPNSCTWLISGRCWKRIRPKPCLSALRGVVLSVVQCGERSRARARRIALNGLAHLVALAEEIR